jgi:spoIIIJ-associated protein
MASKKVLSQGRPLNLQPMTPKERRIVHLALAQIDGVRSQSEGEGEHRSITIHPSLD